MATWGLTGQSTQTTTVATLGTLTGTSGGTFTVASATGFPASGNYDILIDTEEMTVTAGQGTTTWTVTRGVNNTTAAAHSATPTVRQVYNVAATNRIWWNGATFGTNVVVGVYQTSTHLTDNTDTHLCTGTLINHLNNTQYVDGTHFSLNGGGSTLFASNVPTVGSVALAFTFTDPSSVATSATTFYAYDGSTDSTAMAGTTFQAFETTGANTPAWAAANGSGAALSVASQSAATFHIFYIGTSVTPTSTGAKTGKVKMVLTYV